MALSWPDIQAMDEDAVETELLTYPRWSRVTHGPSPKGLQPLDVRRALYQTQHHYAQHRVDHPDAPKTRRTKATNDATAA